MALEYEMTDSLPPPPPGFSELPPPPPGFSEVKTAPTQKTDEEHLSALGYTPDQINKIKSSFEYRPGMIGKSFTDPNYITGSDLGSATGADMGKPGDWKRVLARAGVAIDPSLAWAKNLESTWTGKLLSGAKKGINAGAQLVQTPNEETRLLYEALGKASDLNAKQQGTDTFARTMGQGIPAMAATPVRVASAAPFAYRAAGNAVNASLGAYLTTPGSQGERGKSAGIAAIAAPIFQAGIEGATKAVPYVKRAVQDTVQRWLGLGQAERDKAAQRLAQLELINSRNGTNLNATVGQLTDAPGPQKLEVFAEGIPGGMTSVRQEQNRQSLKALQSYVKRMQAERDALPFADHPQVEFDANFGNLDNRANPARIQGLMDEATTNPQVIQASREGKLYGQRAEYGRMNNETLGLAGDEPVNTDNLLAKINEIRRSDRIPADPREAAPILAELDRVEARLRATPQGGTSRVGGVENASEAYIGGGFENTPPPVSTSGSGMALQEGTGTVVGPRMSITRNGYGDVNSVAARFGDLAEEQAAQGNMGAAKLYGVLRRNSKAELFRHAQDTGNAPLAEAQTAQDAFYHGTVGPNTEGPFARQTNFNTHDPAQTLNYFLEPVNDGRQPWFYRALEDKGRSAIRAEAVERALTKGQDRGLHNKDILSSAKAASALEPDTLNTYFPDATREELDAFRSILRSTERSGQFMENPPTGNRWGLAELLTKGVKTAGGTLGAGVAIRKLLSTPEGRKYLLEQSKLIGSRQIDPAIESDLLNLFGSAASR